MSRSFFRKVARLALSLAFVTAMGDASFARGGFGGHGGGFGHASMFRGHGFGHGMLASRGFGHASLHARGFSHLKGNASFRSSGGLPPGFSHGKASWKQNGGTPPGWSKGKKQGWNCTPGNAGCTPPGLR